MAAPQFLSSVKVTLWQSRQVQLAPALAAGYGGVPVPMAVPYKAWCASGPREWQAAHGPVVPSNVVVVSYLPRV